MLQTKNLSISYRDSLKLLSNHLNELGADNTHIILSLLADTISKDTLFILSNPDNLLTLKETQSLDRLIDKLKRSQPVSYILRNTPFFKEIYSTPPGVLIPRPETELLVQLSLKYINTINGKNEIKNCLEIGTGSGCISISILNNTKSIINFTSTDISDFALKIAKKNSEQILPTDIQTRIKFIKSDFLNSSLDGIFDLIISNPPYIPIDEYNGLSESLMFEPRIALTDNENGLVFYKRLSEIITNHMSIHGVLLMEIHSEHAQKVKKIFKEDHGNKVRLTVHKDTFGRDRVLEVMWK